MDDCTKGAQMTEIVRVRAEAPPDRAREVETPPNHASKEMALTIGIVKSEVPHDWAGKADEDISCKSRGNIVPRHQRWAMGINEPTGPGIDTWFHKK